MNRSLFSFFVVGACIISMAEAVKREGEEEGEGEGKENSSSVTASKISKRNGRWMPKTPFRGGVIPSDVLQKVQKKPEKYKIGGSTLFVWTPTPDPMTHEEALRIQMSQANLKNRLPLPIIPKSDDN